MADDMHPSSMIPAEQEEILWKLHLEGIAKEHGPTLDNLINLKSGHQCMVLDGIGMFWIVLVTCLVGKKQCDRLQALLATVHIVPCTKASAPQSCSLFNALPPTATEIPQLVWLT